MKITIFTSNQPRHMALIHSLTNVATEIFAIVECKINFPGRIPARIPKSPVMEEYYGHVLRAEYEVLGPIRAGDLNYINM
jgi:hypothetical protein